MIHSPFARPLGSARLRGAFLMLERQNCERERPSDVRCVQSTCLVTLKRIMERKIVASWKSDTASCSWNLTSCEHPRERGRPSARWYTSGMANAVARGIHYCFATYRLESPRVHSTSVLYWSVSPTSEVAADFRYIFRISVPCAISLHVPTPLQLCAVGCHCFVQYCLQILGNASSIHLSVALYCFFLLRPESIQGPSAEVYHGSLSGFASYNVRLPSFSGFCGEGGGQRGYTKIWEMTASR